MSLAAVEWIGALAAGAAIGLAAGLWHGRRGHGIAARALDALPVPAQVVASERRVLYANRAMHQAYEDWGTPLAQLLKQQSVGESAQQELARLSPAGGRVELSV